MSPLFYVLFAFAILACALLIACLRVAARADEVINTGGRMPLPTARQRRQWRRERLDLNPALRGKR